MKVFRNIAKENLEPYQPCKPIMNDLKPIDLSFADKIEHNVYNPLYQQNPFNFYKLSGLFNRNFSAKQLF